MKCYGIVLKSLFILTLLLGSLTVFAQDDSPNRQEVAGHQVERLGLNTGVVQFLTGPNQGAPLDIALNYIGQNRAQLGLTEADIADMIVTDQYTSEHNGVTHIYLRQRLNGIEVINGNININIARDGRVINLGNSFVANLAAAVSDKAPGRTATEAVESAARHLGLRLTQRLHVEQSRGGPAGEVILNNGGISLEAIPARLVYQPVADNTVRLAWHIEIAELSGDHWWSMVVDAVTGTVLAQLDYVDHDHWGTPALNWSSGPLPAARTITASPQSSTSAMQVDGASYNVFALPKESPSDGPRTLEVDPAHPIASPFGWHDTNGAAGPEFTVTRGNNVHAYTDVDANNVPDPGSDPNGGPGLAFDFPLDLTQNPPSYRPAAVTNLFYWNNIVHDVFYGYGFNELSGNFQVNNYGRGPTTPPLGANDDVRAEAQDGSDINNANFLTLADGQRPRMQMFIWTYPFVNLVTVNPPSPIAGDYAATNAAFGPQLMTTGPIMADVILALDPANPAGPSETDGCSPLTNAAEVAGNIALLDRGTCPFVDKVLNAQAAGAIGVIVANNVPGSPIVMGGTAPAVVIPSVMVSLDNGDLLKANLPLNATLRDAGDLAVNRDSDLDNGVIVHEYGHGISNRLTGGRTNVGCLGNQEQMGEGWSDWLALVLTTHPDDTATTSRGMGTYVIYQPTDGNGIRPTPYTTDMAVNPSTYDTIKTVAVPHGVGYVWATMLWDMYWNLVEAHGYNPDVYGDWTTGGNNLAIQLVIDGMKMQACSPGFVTGRNAILTADLTLTGGENQCHIWQAFARRGLGFSASQGSSSSVTDGTQAFDLPAVCQAMIDVDPTSLSSTQIPDIQTAQALTISNLNTAGGSNDLVWTITEAPSDCAAPADISWVSAAPSNGSTAPGDSTAVTVAFDSAGLPPATTHTGLLCVSSNDPASSVVEVPLTLNVIYNFSGFFGSISNPPTVNEVRGGSAVSVIFSLDGNQGLDIFAAGFPASQPIDCTTKEPTGSLEPTVSPGGSGLSYNAGTDRYTYPWKTNASWKDTCRQLVVRLTDGTDHIAYFQFKK